MQRRSTGSGRSNNPAPVDEEEEKEEMHAEEEEVVGAVRHVGGDNGIWDVAPSRKKREIPATTKTSRIYNY